MDYIPHTEEEIRQMLKEIGLSNLSDLFNPIPENVKFKSELKIDEGISEQEVLKKMKKFGSKNNDFSNKPMFLGAGFYDHYIPAVIDAITSRGEFLTAYTPYQAEVSQGTLQCIFEYQTVISRLTNHEISNASMYDGGSAMAEAILMAHNIKKKGKILVLPTVNPEYVKVSKTYALGMPEIEILYPETDNLCVDLNYVKGILDKEEIAVVVIQTPNFYGMVEDYESIIKYAKEKEAVVVSCVYPIALGMLEAPSTFGADITIGEGQSLGNYISLGGPHFGFMACKNEFLRKIPGRIVGETVDAKGKRAYCLVLQTREQHIKRDKATSNICSNQALCALRGLIYLSIVGEEGFKEIAQQSYQKAHYLANEIDKIKDFSVIRNADFFNEFVVECKSKTAKEINDKIKKHDMIGGFDLSKVKSNKKNMLMFAVTEKRTKDELDALLEVLKK